LKYIEVNRITLQERNLSTDNRHIKLRKYQFLTEWIFIIQYRQFSWLHLIDKGSVPGSTAVKCELITIFEFYCVKERFSLPLIT